MPDFPFGILSVVHVIPVVCSCPQLWGQVEPRASMLVCKRNIGPSDLAFLCATPTIRAARREVDGREEPRASRRIPHAVRDALLYDLRC